MIGPDFCGLLAFAVVCTALDIVDGVTARVCGR